MRKAAVQQVSVPDAEWQELVRLSAQEGVPPRKPVAEGSKKVSFRGAEDSGSKTAASPELRRLEEQG